MMIDTSNYVCQLTEFSYDKKQLEDICYQYRDKWVAWHQKQSRSQEIYDGPSSDEQIHYRLWDGAVAEHPYIKFITSRINPVLLRESPATFVINNPGYRTLDHIDPLRNSVLMFPITPESPAPIFWKDQDDKVVYTHTYSCPTFINGKIKHGVQNDTRLRIILQLSIIYSTWDEIQELHNNNQIYNPDGWPQPAEFGKVRTEVVQPMSHLVTRDPY
jgi:hypothetical protein